MSDKQFKLILQFMRFVVNALVTIVNNNTGIYRQLDKAESALYSDIKDYEAEEISHE